MNKFLAIALLCISAVSAADFIVSNLYADTAACSGIAYISSAEPVNTCIDSAYASTSSYYTYDANFPGNFTSTTYYTAKGCTGASTSVITNFSSCGFGISYTFSSGVPKFSGYVSSTSTTCGGAPTSVSSVNLGACLPGSSGTSTKFVWYGGSQCVNVQYASTDCTGAISKQSPLGEPSCTSSTFTTSGCQINGAFLAASSLAPSYPSNAPVLVTKYYNLRTDCTGQVEYTSYSRLATCNGKGAATAIVNNEVQVKTYDNYNCSGVLLSTDTDDSNVIGVCSKDSDTSSITTTGSFPASTSSPTAIIQSSCAAGATIYSAYVYASGCIQINSTASGTLACSSLSNGTIQLTANTYGNTGCTGAIVETEVDLEAPCTNIEGVTGLSARFACSAQFSPSSTASTIAVAFSVMLMSFVAALLM